MLARRRRATVFTDDVILSRSRDLIKTNSVLAEHPRYPRREGGHLK